MKQSILTREACNALRGLAIIGIFLHNYCHWLGPIVKENEYQFYPAQHRLAAAGDGESRHQPARPSAVVLRSLRSARIPLPECVRTGDEV